MAHVVDQIRTFARDHAGTIAAALLALTGLIGTLLSISGAIAGHQPVADSGLAIAVLAAFAGWAMRRGYTMAMRQRQMQATREMDSRLADMQDMLERIEDATVDDSEPPSGSNVREFRRGPS